MRLALGLVLGWACGAACAHTGEPRLWRETVVSRAMGRPMDYAVFVPPDRAPGEALPLVLFLHGRGDGPDCLERHAVAAAIAEEMALGRAPRAIIAVPRGDVGFWANWQDGSRRYEDWVVDELLPHLVARYRTRACPDGCHLMGVSMGGRGALHIALHRPGRFGSATSISGPAYDVGAMQALYDDFVVALMVPARRIWGPPNLSSMARDDLWQRWRSPSDLAGTRVFLAWGEQDHPGIVESNRSLHEHLSAREIPHAHLAYPGGHRWEDWTPVIVRALGEQLGGRDGSAPTGL